MPGTGAAATTSYHRAEMTENRLDLALLDPANNEGYGDWPLPCARDEELGALMRVLREPGELPAEARHVPVLLAFAERMAALARREASPDHLRIGLAAARLAGGIGDQRETLLVLPLLWRSADVLGLDAEAEFRTAARTGNGGEVLLEFSDRGPEDRTVEAMGYVEVDDEFGFHYERTW